MDVVLLGPPGAGKGTQAATLAEVLEACHISTGDILRRAVASGSELGREVKALMESGRLVPDETVDRLVAEGLSGPACERGAVFDGYPRTLAQASSLDATLAAQGRTLKAALLIEVSDDAIVRRARVRGRKA